MSQTVDSKVVDLQLNNAEFERNATQSIGTMEKLKGALQFKSSSKDIDGISRSLANVNTGILEKGLGAIHLQFSALDTIADTVIRRMTNGFIDAAAKAKNFIKSVSTDQIKEGWSKYANKTSAVQTIMAATAKNYDNTEQQMADVNAQLEKLNWFTDETSYSFLDMVNNIGKFTSNNIALDKSVTAMEGISTWAAVSGAGINEAGRAMYNLSQAIATGSVKLMDWKSIENANMATAEFKQTAIETAEALGTLTKKGEDTWATLGGKEVSVSNFNSQLSEGWFTGEVLMETLDKYGKFTDELYKLTEETGLYTSDLLEKMGQFKEGTLDLDGLAKETGVSASHLKELFTGISDETMAFGEKAFRAAQEAKTFQEAIDSVKDAVSTGWMNTWEIVFGDYTHAKTLWTSLANNLYDIFAEGGNERNEMLKEAFAVPGESVIDSEAYKRLETMGLADKGFRKAVLANAKAHRKAAGEVTDDLDQITYYSDEFMDSLESGWLTKDLLQETMDMLLGTGETTTKAVGDIEKIREAAKKVVAGDFGNDMTKRFEEISKLDLDPQQVQDYVNAWSKASNGTWEYNDAIKEQIESQLNLSKATSETSDATTKLSDETLKSLGVTEAYVETYKKAVAEAQESGASVEAVLVRSGYDLWVEGLNNIMDTILNVVTIAKTAWDDIFPPLSAIGLYQILDGFNKFTTVMVESTDAEGTLQGAGRRLYLGFKAIASVIGIVVDIFKAIGSVIGGIVNAVWSNFGDIILDTAENIDLMVIHLKEWIDSSEILQKISGGIVGIVNKAAGAIRNWIDNSEGLEFIRLQVIRFRAAFSLAFKSLPDFFKGVTASFNLFLYKVKELGGIKELGITGVFEVFKNTVLKFVKNFKGFDSIKKAFSFFSDDIKTRLSGITETVSKVFNDLREKLKGTFLGNVLDVFAKVIETIQNAIKHLKDSGVSIGSIFDVIKEAIGNVFGLLSKVKFGDVVKVGGLAILGKTLYKIFNFLSGRTKKSLLKTVQESISSLGDVFDSASGVLKAKKIQTISEAIKSFAIAIAILVGSIAVLTMLDQGKMLVAVGVIAALSLLMTGLLFAFSKLNTGKMSIRTSAGLIAIASAVLILVIALEKLQGIKSNGLARSMVLLATLMGSLVAVTVVLSKLAPKMSTGTAGLLFIAIAIRLLVGAIADLDKLELKDPMKTIGMLTAIVVALGALSFVSQFGSLTGSLGLLVTVASLKLLIGSVKDLAALNPESLDRTIKSIGEMILQLSLLMGSLTIIGLAGPAAFIGIAALMALVAGIGFIFDVLGESIGEGIAKFASAATSTLPEIGANLAGFMTNAQPFIDGCKNMSAEDFAGLTALANSIITIAKGEFLSSLVELFTGENPITAFVDDLQELAAGMSLYASNVSDEITEDKVTKSTTLLNMLAGIVANKISDGGIVGWLTGNATKIKDFANQLPTLATALSAYAKEINSTDFNDEKITASGNLVTLLADLTNEEIPEGGVIGWLKGNGNKITVFSKQLPGLAKALSGYVKEISDTDFSDEKITASTNLISILSGLANDEIPDGGIFGWLEGNGTKIASFATQLPTLATGLAGYVRELGDDTFSSDNITASTNLASVLGTLVGEEIPDGGIFGWLEGNGEKISSFSAQLPTLATGLASYVEALGTTDFTSDNVTASNNLASVLGSLVGEEIPDGGVIGWLEGNSEKISTFSAQLPILADGLVGYINALGTASFTSENVTASSNLASVLSSLAGDDIPDGGVIGWVTGNSTKIGDFSKQLPSLATGLAGFIEKLPADTNSNDIGNAVGALSTIAGLKVPDGGLIGFIAGNSTVIEEFGKQLPTLGSGIQGFITSLPQSVNTDLVKSATDAIGDISAISVPEGGLFGWISGNGEKFSNFAGQLKTLGQGITDFITVLPEKVDTDILDSTVDALTKISEIGNTIQSQDLGQLDYASAYGDTDGDYSAFAAQIKTLYSTVQEVSGYTISTDNLLSINTAITDISALEFSKSDIAKTGTVDKVSKNVDSLATMIENLVDIDTSGVDDFVSSLNKINSADLSSAADTIANKASSEVSNSTNKESMTKSGSDLASSASSGFSAGASGMKSAASSLVSNAASAFQGAAISQFKGYGSRLSEAVANGISAFAYQSKNAASNLVSSAVSALGDTRSDPYQSGVYFGIGFRDGIRDMIPSVVAEARSMVQRAKDMVKQTQREGSPAKELIKSGKWFAIGFGVGIANELPYVDFQSKRLASNAIRIVNDTIAQVSETIEDGIDTQPVIRPVLDLGDIQSKSGELSSMLDFNNSPTLAPAFSAIGGNLAARDRVSQGDILSALTALGATLSDGGTGNTYIVNGVTYDDGSNITSAVRDLIHAARVERRV